MANFDALTGVADRHRLMCARRDESRYFIQFTDIDGFKAINDRLGHAAGDAVLVALYERLGILLRGDEMFGRASVATNTCC